MRIDLNADVGESAAPVGAEEAALLSSVTSINVACGVHAGTPSSIREILRLARGADVTVGAHPSLADREGFGRRPLPVSPSDIENLVIYQVSALIGIAKAEGLLLHHVKPHGTLYHMAVTDDAVAAAIAHAVRMCDQRLGLVAFAGSRLIAAGQQAGLVTLAEGFADRAYAPDGMLVPRGQAGAVIEDERQVVSRALRMVREHRVLASDDRTELTVVPDTICIHSDTPGAAQLARALRAALEGQGVLVAAAQR